MVCKICDQVGGPLVKCAVCGFNKPPRGRAAPLSMVNGMCSSDCPGYDEDPIPEGLWPGERYGDSLGHMKWHEEIAG